ncbi:hypothetical protein QR680_016025 [Steinernema hermaphroditum]|uniref:Sulfotransferase domain-containing protein n=1 Tax=Steinernema hermaphroditum TaxID=289476 RepID=A0AA39LL88_9BILA|nr:hypothetical protein QR680_016025 [Steinernema hermaphroditum]
MLLRRMLHLNRALTFKIGRMGIIVCIIISCCYFCMRAPFKEYSGEERKERGTIARPVLPPFINMDSPIKHARKYKLATCSIAKNMSTIMTALFCFLMNSKAFVRANRTIPTESYFTRFCLHSNEHASIEALLNSTKTTIDDWTMIVVVREPLERFLSGFLDKCVLNTVGHNVRDNCYGCGKDVGCVLERLYQRAWYYTSIPEATRNSFINLEDYHFFPQNWHCSMQQYLPRYVTLKYSSDRRHRTETIHEIANVLQEANVPSNEIEYILRQTTSYTNHSTVHSHDRLFYHDIITSSSRLLELMYNIYYYDYAVFGYGFNYRDARPRMFKRPESSTH